MWHVGSLVLTTAARKQWGRQGPQVLLLFKLSSQIHCISQWQCLKLNKVLKIHQKTWHTFYFLLWFCLGCIQQCLRGTLDNIQGPCCVRNGTWTSSSPKYGLMLRFVNPGYCVSEFAVLLCILCKTSFIYFVDLSLMFVETVPAFPQ